MNNDPVLKAIDDLQSDVEYDFDETSGRGEKYREHVTAIRTAYLTSKKTATTIKYSSTIQENKECMFERMAETVISWTAGCYPAETDRIKRSVNQLREAHNADRAADKQSIMALKEELDGVLSVNDNANRHIAKLEAELESLRKLTEVTLGVGYGAGKLFVHGDHDSINHLQKLLLSAKENQHFHYANVEKHYDGSLTICWGGHERGEECKYIKYYTEQHISELIPKVVKPHPNDDGSYDCSCNHRGDGGLYRTDNYCYRCGAKLDWEE